MAKILEMSRVREIETNRWVVEIFSPIGRWIVQGVHTNKAAAERDRKNWL